MPQFCSPSYFNQCYELPFMNLCTAFLAELHARDPNYRPHFELSYTTESEYGLKDLSPAQWATVVTR